MLVGFFAIRWTVSLPWPDWDLPSIPWPDWDLPAIPWLGFHLPDWPAPAWVAWPADHRRYVCPVVVAVVVARAEIKRQRQQDARQAQPEIEVVPDQASPATSPSDPRSRDTGPPLWVAARGQDGLMSLRPMTRSEWLRFAGNLVNFSTPAGLLVATVGRARCESRPGGLFLCEGYRLPFPIAGAFTVGNVITTRSRWAELVARYPDLLRHEERHTWQWLYCAGVGFLPAYGACLIWSVLRTGDRAAGNFFERSAGLATGGYRDLPQRPVFEGVRAVLGQKAGWLRSRS